MPAKLHITDQRMLQLMDYAVKNNLVETESEYWAKIKFLRNNLSNLRAGKHGFTRDQIRNACLVTGASANWLLDIEPGPMFRDRKKKGSLQLLKEAVTAVESEYGKGKSGR